MKSASVPWFRIAVLVTELSLVAAAIIFPLVISDTVLPALLKILELVAATH